MSFPVLGLLSVVPCELAPGQSQIKLRGIVRDFQQSHVDMDVLPIGGTGHYAGNINLALNSANRPVFSGSGSRVWKQWLESGGLPIAPHLYIAPTSGGNNVLVAEEPQGTNSPTIDSFDSTLGPYGGSNVGPAPNFVDGSTMAVISPPAGLPFISKYEVSGGTHTITASFRCDEFIVKDNATVRILGNIVIRADDKVDIINQSDVEILSDSSLELWAGKDLQITDYADLNMNTANPALCHIYYWGGNGNTFKIQNHSEVYARVISPNADLLLQDTADLFGVFEGKKLILQNSSGYHHDSSGGVKVCGVPVYDTAGAFATASPGGIDSASSFDQWYVDFPGVNLSVQHSITMTDNGSGVFEYHDDGFFPIDGRLFGNEGMAHNHYFTFTVSAFFTYSQCGGQFFEFAGADDCWVFINDQLAMDLGGIIPGTNQVIPIDRLGLTDGETYEFRLFYAQRQGTGAAFHVRTNLELATDPFVATASGGFD